MGLKWYGPRVRKVAVDEAMEALWDEADIILDSAMQITPLNKDPWMAWHRGTLRSSGQALPRKDQSGVDISFGVHHERFNYAELQHDTTWFEHEYPGQPFFLRIPFNARTTDPTFFLRLQSRVRNRLRSAP